MMSNYFNRLKSLAISEIFLILMGIVAFAFIVGNISIVEAQAVTGVPTGTSNVRTIDVGLSASATQAATKASGGGGGFFGSSLVQGLLAAVLIGGLVYFVAQSIGEDEGVAKALGLAVGGGIFTHNLLANVFKLGGGIGGVVGLGVGIAIFVYLYEKTEQELVQFICLPYEPPLGGNDCDQCNQDELRPCSEYRCRSLGQACQLVNEGTEQEKCVWVNQNDVESPIITPWDEPLTKDHQYANHNTRPPSLGTKITRIGGMGCLQAFTPLQFGITTNEPAQCKIDSVHTDTFDEMKFYFGESNYLVKNHTQKLNLPSPDSINSESPTILNDGTYDFYVRCRDANGNENVEEFVFSMCVDPSPDTTPPIIVDTSIVSGSPVAFGAGSTNLEVYVNEPATCKWSINDRNYDDMENDMACASSVVEINAQNLYTCSTTLTSIKDRQQNDYYFRCKDQPNKPNNERNVNVQSYKYSILGTQPLDIIEFGPNGTIKDNTDLVKVDLDIETSNGAEEGKAICYFSPTGNQGSYVSMFETNSFNHRQTLSLAEGDYTYYYRCVDAGGNAEESITNFKVRVDKQSPTITRAYRENDALKLVTNEEGECAYSLNNCNFNFDEGIAFLLSNPSVKTNHFAPWNPDLPFYIKCRDNFGNLPNPSECSLIATASNIA